MFAIGSLWGHAFAYEGMQKQGCIKDITASKTVAVNSTTELQMHRCAPTSPQACAGSFCHPICIPGHLTDQNAQQHIAIARVHLQNQLCSTPCGNPLLLDCQLRHHIAAAHLIDCPDGPCKSYARPKHLHAFYNFRSCRVICTHG